MSVIDEKDEEYLVEDAQCVCKHGAAPSRIKVLKNDFCTIGGKYVATFQGPDSLGLQTLGCGGCNMHMLYPLMSNPCEAEIVAASNLNTGLTVEGAPTMTLNTTLTCAKGTPDCISFIDSGQVFKPLAPKQIKAIKSKNKSEPQTQAKLVQLAWQDENGGPIDSLPANGMAKIWARVENPGPDEVLEVFLNLNSKCQKTFEIPVNKSGIAEKILRLSDYYCNDPEQVRFSAIAYLTKNLDSSLDVHLQPFEYQGCFADENEKLLEKAEFNSKVRFYLKDFYAYQVTLEVLIEEKGGANVILLEDKLSNLIPNYSAENKYFEFEIKSPKDYPALKKLDKLRLRCDVKDGGGWVKMSLLDEVKVEKVEEIVIFNPDLSEDRKKIVSPFTISVLEKAAINSANNKLIITSTIRSTKQQAEIMYSNESNGNHISYAAAGKEVIEIYNIGKRRGDAKEKIISDMDQKITELAYAGQRVSLHCVLEEMYKKHNILDISYKRGLTNPQDFIRELAKDSAVTKIIHPLSDVVSSDKVRYDAKEDAIHVEIKII